MFETTPTLVQSAKDQHAQFTAFAHLMRVDMSMPHTEMGVTSSKSGRQDQSIYKCVDGIKI